MVNPQHSPGISRLGSAIVAVAMSSSNDAQPIDLIGDLHGAIGRFQKLIDELGYHERGGRWMHPEGRGLVFLGDYIDRGPDSYAVFRTVRKMVDDGVAVALMGNHELNAIAFSTRANDGTLDARQAHRDAGQAIRTGCAVRGWQRPHETTLEMDGRRNLINIHHHRATIVSTSATEYQEMVDWFVRLPLWLELPELRAVHAAWIPSAIDSLRTWAREHDRRNPGLDASESPVGSRGPATFAEAARECQRRSQTPAELKHTRAMLLLLDTRAMGPTAQQAAAIEQILKGPELPLAERFPDPEGTMRDRFRIRWFDAFRGQTMRAYRMTSNRHRSHAPATAEDERTRARILDNTISEQDAARLDADVRAGYGAHERPVFFGHYGLHSAEIPEIGHNWACLDYSGFHPDGALAAYRWDGAVDASVQDGSRSHALLRADRVRSVSWLQRQHPEHGTPIEMLGAPQPSEREQTALDFVLTLLNCDSTLLQNEGRRRAESIAKVDRETSGLLGLPRVWTDETPAPLDPTIVQRIQETPAPSKPHAPVVLESLKRRRHAGLPNPSW